MSRLIKIETYRGFDISFDKKSCKFLAYSDSFDNESLRASFPAAKKYVDEFLKENSKFKPFFVMKWGKHNNLPVSEKRLVIGIRKDKRFVYENGEGKKVPISDYNEGDYVLYRTVDSSKVKGLQDIDSELDAIRERLIKASEGAKEGIITLRDYKKNLELD